MKPTLAEFIENSYTHGLGFDNDKMTEFPDDYMNLHGSLLIMDIKTGNIPEEHTIDRVYQLAEGFTYEQLLHEKMLDVIVIGELQLEAGLDCRNPTNNKK